MLDQEIEVVGAWLGGSEEDEQSFQGAITINGKARLLET